MIELKKLDEKPFRMVMETLTRVGVYTSDKKEYLQKIFIVSFYGHDYLVHYKDILDRDMDTYDDAYLNTVAILLKNWGIAEPIDFDQNERVTIPKIFVLSKEQAEKTKLTSQVTSDKITDFITRQKVNRAD